MFTKLLGPATAVGKLVRRQPHFAFDHAHFRVKAIIINDKPRNLSLIR